MALASVNARYTFSGEALRTLCSETLLLDIKSVCYFVPTNLAFRFCPFFLVVAAPLTLLTDLLINFIISKVMVKFDFDRVSIRQVCGLFTTSYQKNQVIAVTMPGIYWDNSNDYGGESLIC